MKKPDMKRLLVGERTRQTYFESIKPLAKSTQRMKRIAIQSLDRYCYEKFQIKTIDDLIPELQKSHEHQLYDFLQGWINWEKLADVKNRFSHINSYLYYFGIKLDSQDVKHNLKFPKKLKREQYPVSKKEIHEIISPVPYSKKALYLALISSGLRIGELVRLRKKDIDLNGNRIKIIVPAEIAKNGISRITWLSKEAQRYNIKKIRNLKENDLVWGSSGAMDFEHNVINEDSTFRTYTDKAGLDMRYSSGTRKITIHSLRSYFITKGNKIEFGFGHALAGHDYYMKQYDRYTQDELYQMFLKLEPELAIFEKQVFDSEHKLKEQSERIRKLEEQINKNATDNMENMFLVQELLQLMGDNPQFRDILEQLKKNKG